MTTHAFMQRSSRHKTRGTTSSRRAVFEHLESRQLLTGSPQLVADLSTGAHIYIDAAVPIDGYLYFQLLQNPVSSLWRTDGTVQGTSPVVSSEPSNGLHNISSLVESEGNIYFATADAGENHGVWRVESGAAAASQIWSGREADGVDAITNLLASAGELHFTVSRTDRTTDLWKSDGTPQGTELIRNLPVAYARELTLIDGTLFFGTGKEDMEQPRLWRSDGTFDGTIVLNETFRSADDVPGPRWFTEFQDVLYFVADRSLWRSDGTELGTYAVMQGLPGYGYGESLYKILVATQEALYFVANDGVSGYELWTTDGTAAGSRRVADIAPGAESSFPSSITATNDAVYFAAGTSEAAEPAVRDALWRTDGTEAGTQLISHVDVRELVYAGDTLFFGGYVIGDVERLWSSDGTAGGTRPVPLAPGTNPTNPGNLQVSGSRLYFYAKEPSTGYEMWVLEPAPEDLDQSFRVDPRDLALLVGNFGLTGADLHASGDIDGDGLVGLRDAIALRNRLSVTTSPQTSAAAVVSSASVVRHHRTAAVDTAFADAASELYARRRRETRATTFGVHGGAGTIATATAEALLQGEREPRSSERHRRVLR